MSREITAGKEKIVLRLDDVGASSKEYNQHGKVYWKIFGKPLPVAFFSNWFFFKRIKPFANWAVYQELGKDEWTKIFLLLKSRNAKLTVGVTACWALSENELVPFNKKFPVVIAILKEGVEEGLIEIANHGLCHCVLKDNLFHPKLFSSNRIYHREFWEWLPDEVHKNHIEKSQEILTKIFKKDIVTFIPPGNVWTEVTEYFAKSSGIKYLSSLEDKAPTGIQSNGIIYIGNKKMIDFHDREISLYGTSWLEKQMDQHPGEFCTVQDYLKN